jgi:hypothetical protein
LDNRHNGIEKKRQKIVYELRNMRSNARGRARAIESLEN